MRPAMTKQQEELTAGENTSRFELYKKLAVGKQSYAKLFYYELCLLLFGNLPGLPGLGLRSLFYPYLFQACGKKTAFGKSMVIRNPNQCKIGANVLIDDFTSLDIRGENSSIEISDFSIIGRFTTLAAKGGEIILAKGANIGSYCRIATNSKIEIGESSLIAAYCYIGPGNHQQGEAGKPLISQEMEIKGGVKIGAHTWIGARTTILDGVSIGDNAIIGAHSFVKDDIPSGAVAFGSPAKIVKT